MKVKYTNKPINITNVSDFREVSKAIKTHFKRDGRFNIIDILHQEGIYLPKCAFCGQPNSYYFLVCELIDDLWQIRDVDLTHGGKTDCIHYCRNNLTCPGKKLNPNSVEFVSKTRNISEDAALEYIHDRNKSPFYQKNHDDVCAYKNNQSKFAKLSEADLSHILSNTGYEERYGSDWGKIKLAHNESKSITLENLQKRYGLIDGANRHREWIRNTDISLENMKLKHGNSLGSMKYMNMISKFNNYGKEIKTIDDFIEYCLFILRKNSFYKMKSYPIERVLLSKKGVSSGMEYFNIAVGDLITLLKDTDNTINKFNVGEGERMNFGNVYFTTNGKMLRSTYELEFYLGMLTIGLTDDDLVIDSNYPEQTKRFDFYIKPLNIYVEIAGMMELSWYREKMAMKEHLYNALIVEPDRMFETIQKIKDML